MGKRILLLAPTFLDLYQDLISELNRQGYNTTYIKDKEYKFDPFFFRKKSSTLNQYIYTLFLNIYWHIFLLFHKNIIKEYDYLLVINGMSFHPYLLEQLKKKNKDIYSVLYLWDRTYNNYKFNRNFINFNKIATFDKVDAHEYNLIFLPLYWIQETTRKNNEYTIFAFGGFRQDRYKLFKQIKDIFKNNSTVHNYIKILVRAPHKNTIWKIKQLIKKILKIDNDILKKIDDKEIIETIPLSPSEFRNKIYTSECIIDTNNIFQEGMTPRFMWALGAQKKIITTNKNVINYTFYDDSRIFITNENINKEALLQFLKTPIINKPEFTSEILPFRIDNWIITLLSNHY